MDIFLENAGIEPSSLNVVARMNDLESIKKIYCKRAWIFHSFCQICR